MTDYPTAFEVARLKKTVAYLASYIAAVYAAASSYGSGSLLSLTTLRAADSVTLQGGTIFLIADVNGDPGVFYYDSSSSAADDGLTVIVDAAGRRWLRLNPIV